MLVSFFEEYPTPKNMSGLKHVTWPTKLYIAAKSLEEFTSIKRRYKNKRVKEWVYWPVLEREEGYWISPFSKRSGLERVLRELEGTNVPVMLDLELPTTQNPRLYVTESHNFFRNKKLIKEFIQNHSGGVYLAEYYPDRNTLFGMLGIHYNLPNTKIMKMCYHSMHAFNEKRFESKMRRGVQEFKRGRYVVGLGTIAVGEQGNEPRLSVPQLRKDLQIARKCGVREAVIFRLGGLGRTYAKSIEEFGK